MLEGAASVGGAVVGRTRSLTEEDLEELKGCLDLGFGFTYNEIPGLCATLPGLELCYSMTRRFLDEQRAPGHLDLEPAEAAAPIPDWKISGPGKTRFLRMFLFWLFARWRHGANVLSAVLVWMLWFWETIRGKLWFFRIGLYLAQLRF
jgi:hypothetical protein